MEQIIFNKNKELDAFWPEGRSKNGIIAIQESIRRAVHDIMARTLTVKAGETWNLADELSSDKSKLVRLFDQYFKNLPIGSEPEFDRWHSETCMIILAILEKKYEQVHYGKSQKILNMAFKNLYCTKFGENEEYFKFCHMPFDSYTLEWTYRNVYPLCRDNAGKALTKDKTPSWSNLSSHESLELIDGKYTYEFLTKCVRQVFEAQSITVLQGEFVIWNEIQFEMAAEAFYSQLIKDKDTENLSAANFKKLPVDKKKQIILAKLQ